MLKVPDHQVGGHKAVGGKLGPLIDDSGHFFKPLQDDGRGAKEVEFYTSFSSNKRIPDHIRKFFPIYHGTKLLEASDGSGLMSHLELQDVVQAFDNPSVMDVKIGSRTWYPEASEEYIEKCLKKDKGTTSCWLGFRISGLQKYIDKELGYWKPKKKIVQGYTVDDVRLVLRKFVSSDKSLDSNSKPDCSLASSIYGGSCGILAQLLELKAWFEDQTMYHFNSCSILLLSDKGSTSEGGSGKSGVTLVDFAHVVDGKGVIDHNFLGGLCSLIKFISEILTSPDDYSINTSSLESREDLENGTEE